MKQVPQRFETPRNALIALGSNAISPFGDVAATVQKSSLEVSARLGGAGRVSGLYRTPAFPTGAGPDFINAAMQVETTLPAVDVLAILHQIEADAGRQRVQRWGERTLDLDLLALGDLVCPDPATFAEWRDLDLEAQKRDAPDQLILPHPRLQDRSFVLIPLMDVAADWVHPVSGQSVRQMAAARPAAERDTVVRLRF